MIFFISTESGTHSTGALEWPTATTNIFSSMTTICAELGNVYQCAYSDHFTPYITSLAQLYLKIQQMLFDDDDDGGLKTPTNFPSCLSMTSGMATSQEDQNTPVNAIGSGINELSFSATTPVNQSVSTSPTEEMSSIGITSSSTFRNKNAHLLKVPSHRLIYTVKGSAMFYSFLTIYTYL